MLFNFTFQIDFSVMHKSLISVAWALINQKKESMCACLGLIFRIYSWYVRWNAQIYKHSCLVKCLLHGTHNRSVTAHYQLNSVENTADGRVTTWSASSLRYNILYLRQKITEYSVTNLKLLIFSNNPAHFDHNGCLRSLAVWRALQQVSD